MISIFDVKIHSKFNDKKETILNKDFSKWFLFFVENFVQFLLNTCE